MIGNIKETNCTGCRMCGDICPKNAITFIESYDGFYYPKVDIEKCNNCGRCIKKCPNYENGQVITSHDLYIPIAFGAKSRDEGIRMNSTSGGVFSELAQSWMSGGGLCCGAVYDNNQEVKHKLCGQISDISALRQSKYVQSNASNIYAKTCAALQKGEKVMFCGTPCQIGALKSYLGANYENLICLDFICLGVCSPLIYREYLQLLRKKYRSDIASVWFKNKKEGWHSLGTQIPFNNGKVYFREGKTDRYMVLFVEDFFSLRPSCEFCRYRSKHHISDITLGDFWGLDNLFPGRDDDKGTSAVIINTQKGKTLFDSISDKIDKFQCTVDDIASDNNALLKPPLFGKKRREFYASLNKHGLKRAMNEFSVYSGFEKIKRHIKRAVSPVKKSLKRIIKGVFLKWEEKK